MRNAVYAVIVVVAALFGATALDRPGDNPDSLRPPTTITIATRDIDEPSTTSPGVTTWPAPATAPADPRLPEHPTDTAVDVSLPAGSNIGNDTIPPELVHDDVDGTPITPRDVASQFALAAFNDRYDTSLEERRLALGVWATPDIAAAWTERMTNTQRAVNTVRSATATTVSVTQVDATTWNAAVTAAVTESNADGPTTVVDHHLELSLTALADGLRVTAADELAAGP